MATRKGSTAAAKSRRDGSKAVAHARSSARSGVASWVVAGGIVAVATALVVLLTIAKSTGGQRTSPTKGPDINNPPVAKLYLQEFDTIWNASAVDHGLRVARRGGS